MRTILVIEDDFGIRRGVVDALEFSGYRVIQSADAPSGLAAALREACDLLLLDLVLPGGDGLDILSEVRRVRPTLPVIVLTARGAESDRLRGLRGGADDYVVKPFSVRELLARVEAVLRRSPERPRDVQRVAIPGGEADLERCEVRFRDGTNEELSQIERDLLSYLAANAGRAISRDELLERVWHVSPRGLETRTVDMHVARLREKLRDDSAAPRVIVTVRGAGYKFSRGEDRA
ncbi:MAG: response regulator transcription factor [Phycisphaerae bacterium]